MTFVPQKNTEDLVTFTEEICNGKLHILCSENSFLLFGNDRRDNGHKFSYERFGRRRPCFQATSHLKFETKVFFP